MINDRKYIVFKRDEWEAGSGNELEDAVVIRRQDVFAPPALDAYSNAIQVVIETMTHGFGATGDRMLRLQEIADYFADQAAKSWTETRKLPD